MTAEQIVIVQDSFSKVKPISEQAAALFYGRLFELDPTTKPLFKGDMAEQGRKLMQTLALVVNSLTRLDELVPVVQELGKRHITYGVQPSHYETAGDALLWTLEQGLGESFTPEVKDAWIAAYTTLSDVLIEAAEKKD